MERLLMRFLVRFPAASWLLGVVGIVLMVVGAVKLHEFRHIQQAGVTTQGTLTSLTGESKGKADVEYSFDVNGKHYTGQGEVGGQEREGLNLGDKIKVVYLADDPTKSLTGVSWPSTPYGFLFGGAALLFLPFVVTIARRRKRR